MKSKCKGECLAAKFVKSHNRKGKELRARGDEPTPEREKLKNKRSPPSGTQKRYQSERKLTKSKKKGIAINW